METDIALAIQHALDLARSSGGALASITLRSKDTSALVRDVASAVFTRLGLPCPEIHVQPNDGPIQIVAIEIDRTRV